MDRKLRKIVLFCLVCVFAVSATCATAYAQDYSTEYPHVFNSGSPYWFSCTVDGFGDYVVLIDPDINVQSFGFDKPTGYNLINNTGSTINGRAYKLDDKTGYLVRFPSYYCMQFKEPGTNSSQWFDVYISNITGTTLDFIDIHGSRGNDNLSIEEVKIGHEVAQTILLCVIGLCMFLRSWFKFTYRQRGKWLC